MIGAFACRASDGSPFEVAEAYCLTRQEEDHSVATPQEREQQRKQKQQSEFDRQVDNGSLVVRQMTAEERAKYAESPEAAAEREARGRRKRG